VHFHTGSGCGDFFDDSGADPMLLSPILNDPDLRKTNIVLLHGNPPRERSVSMLILKPNVYTDISVLELLWSPPELARILRPYLETAPEHVMFGTDAGPFAPGLEWEETTIIGSQHARRALAIVLSEMVRDGTITRDRAKEIATLVLRGNAAKLYGL
jgi:predicted TIM-barrel fold metal-dependent hydrolase